MGNEQVSATSRSQNVRPQHSQIRPHAIRQASAKRADNDFAGRWREAAVAVDRAIGNLYRTARKRARREWLRRLLRL